MSVPSPACGDLDELLRMGDREGLEDDRIDQAENGRISANAKRQRKNRHRGESRTGAKRPKGIAKILHEGVEHNANYDATSPRRLAKGECHASACGQVAQASACE